MFVLVSTGLNTMYLPKFEADIQKLQDNQTELDKRRDRRWESHKRADNMERDAVAQMNAFLAGGEQNTEIYLPEVGDHLRGAVLNMLAAVGKTDDEIDQYAEPVETLVQGLKVGDLTNYEKLRKFLNDIRLESAKSINVLKPKREELDKEKTKIRESLNYYRLLVALMNVLGLALVLLKDLAIRKPNERSST